VKDVLLDKVEAKEGSPMLDASDLSAPAAAMICGLSGLGELAKLPFLECCIPWTIGMSVR
jgi:hypothetical protein